MVLLSSGWPSFPRVEREYTGTSSKGGVDVAWKANAVVMHCNSNTDTDIIEFSLLILVNVPFPTQIYYEYEIGGVIVLRCFAAEIIDPQFMHSETAATRL